MRERFFQNSIALVYDFDGTLSPQPMQEYTVLPRMGIAPREFWDKVNDEARATESDMMLVYMRHILESLDRQKIAVKREDFAKMAGAIRYFPGVEGWFARINAYVRKRSGGRAKVHHYLISAGQKLPSTLLSVLASASAPLSDSARVHRSGTTVQMMIGIAIRV